MSTIEADVRMTLDGQPYFNIEDLGITCPVCKKDDFCMIGYFGKTCICGRTTSKRKIGKAGHMHECDVDMSNLKMNKPKNTRPPNWESIHSLYRDKLKTGPVWTQQFFKEFGMSSDIAFDCGYDGEAIVMPMFDAEMNIIGLIKRYHDGAKKFVPNSKLGIFDDHRNIYSHTLVICEGFTDTATAWSLNVPQCKVIGRASCNSGHDYVLAVAKRFKPHNIRIIADNDEPGIEGARDLCKMLCGESPETVGGKSIQVMAPPKIYKDLRKWKQSGLQGNWRVI